MSTQSHRFVEVLGAILYSTVQCSIFERISSRKRSRSTVPSRTNERKSGKMSHICLEESCIVPYGPAQGSLLDVLSLWSVLLFPLARLVDQLCVIQLREISP